MFFKLALTNNDDKMRAFFQFNLFYYNDLLLRRLITMQHTYIDSSKPLKRYFTPQDQYLIQCRERAVEP